MSRPLLWRDLGSYPCLERCLAGLVRGLVMAFTGVCHETTKRASIVASVISVAMLSLRNITIADELKPV